MRFVILALLILVILSGAFLALPAMAGWQTDQISGDNTYAYVAVDSAGLVHAMYQIPGNGYGCNCGPLRSFVRLAPNNLKEISYPSDPINAVRPSMAVDAQRNQYVVYEKEWAGQTSIIRYNYVGNNNWVREGPYDIPGMHGYSPRIVIGPTGNIHIVTAQGGYVHYVFHAGTSNLSTGWVGPSEYPLGGWGDGPGIAADATDAALIPVEVGGERAGDMVMLRYVNGVLASAQQFTANTSTVGYRWPTVATDYSTGISYIFARGFESGDYMERWTRDAAGNYSGPVHIRACPSGGGIDDPIVAARDGKVIYMWRESPGPLGERFSMWYSDGVSAPQCAMPGYTITPTNLVLDPYGGMFAGAAIWTETNVGNFIMSNPSAATTGVLTGTVRDQNNNAVVGASVVAQGSTPYYQTTTDANGVYRIAYMWPDTYSVTVSKLGYVNQTKANKVVTANQTTTVDFSLTRTQGSVTGFVKEPDGTAVTGATVTATGPSTYSTTTASDGSYTLPGVTYGTYSIGYYKFGYTRQSAQSAIGYDGQINTINITLAKTTIPDAKKAADGTAVELLNKVITAIDLYNSCYYVQEPDCSSGIRCSGDAPGMAPGDVVNVSGTASAYKVGANVQERQLVTGQPQKQNSSALRPAGMSAMAVGGAAVSASIPGVKNGRGTNNIGLLVKVWGKVSLVDGSKDFFLDDGSGADNVTTGGTAVAGVRIHSNSAVSVLKDSIVSVTGVVTGFIPSGWSTNCRYILIRSASDIRTITSMRGTITGVVKDSANNAVSGATVSTSTGGYSSTTGSDGRYTLVNVYPGSYSVTASKAGYTSATRSAIGVQVDVTSTADFIIDAIKGTIAGAVKDTSNTPVSGVTVSTDTGGYSTTTDGSGNYNLSLVSPGTYSVTAAKSGYTGSSQSGITVTAGQSTTCNLTITPLPGSISGTVKDTASNPIAGAAVSTGTGGYSTTSGADGSYTLSGVAAGTYSVTASKAGFASQSNSVTVPPGGAATSNFSLGFLPGSITGVVKDASNNLLSGATVTTSPGNYSATTAANGSYTITGVPVGSYSVTASKAGYNSSTTTGVSVLSNQATTANFTLTLSSVERLNNGNMEGGFFSTGWTTSCSGFNSQLPSPAGTWGWNNDASYPFNTFDSMSMKHAGSHALGFAFCQSAPDPGKFGVATQSVNVGAPNASAIFSCWGYWTNGNCIPIMCWNPGAGQTNPSTAFSAGRFQQVCTSGWGQMNTWVSNQMTVTADSSGYVTVIVGGSAWPGTPGGANVYIDDVSVK